MWLHGGGALRQYASISIATPAPTTLSNLIYDYTHIISPYIGALMAIPDVPTLMN